MSNKNEFQTPLHPVIELVTAIAADKANAADFDGIDSANINVVQNTDSQVALVLPYHSFLDDVSSSAPLADEDLNDAAGGFSFVDRLTPLTKSLDFYQGLRERFVEEGRPTGFLDGAISSLEGMIEDYWR